MITNLCELNRKVINRKANGKTIWQPRIGCWYDDRVFRKEDFPGEYKGLDLKGIYEKIGCSNRLYDFNICLEKHFAKDVVPYARQIDELRTEHGFDTPLGRVYQIISGNTSNSGRQPIKWLIEDDKDLEIMSYIEETAEYSFNTERYNQMCDELCHLGLPIMFLPRVNMQAMFIEFSGVENSIYMLADYPDEMEAFFESLSKGQEKMMKVVANSPIEWINYGDNIHSKILSPALFEKYVLPEYEKRGDILHKAGKFIHSHWDGDTKELLPYAKHCFLDGIEAITPLPQGDVTVKEIKEALGDEIFLIDGLAAVLFSDIYPIEELKKQTEEVLNLFEGQLVLGISDEFPSDGNLERLEYVNEIVNEFNAKR